MEAKFGAGHRQLLLEALQLGPSSARFVLVVGLHPFGSAFIGQTVAFGEEHPLALRLRLLVVAASWLRDLVDHLQARLLLRHQALPLSLVGFLLEALPGHPVVSPLITSLKVLLIRLVVHLLRACQRLEVASVLREGRQD